MVYKKVKSKEYIKISFWTVIFLITTFLASSANSSRINYYIPQSIVKKKYPKTLFHKKIRSTEVDRFPPTLTDLNYSWKPSYIPIVNNNILTDCVIKNAKGYLGTPYRYGGKSLNGMDCSALVKQSFEPYEFLPRVSAMQAKEGIRIARNKIEKGDLVFFSINQRRSHKKGITHVGIIVVKKKI